MHTKAIVAGVVAAGCSLAAANSDSMEGMIAKDVKAIERRADSDTSSVTRTPKWASTVAPEKLSLLHSDMQVLASSIRTNTLYSSMTAVLATAVPQSFKDAAKSAPSSIHDQYRTEKPEWYMSMPADIRSFMDHNRIAAKSIFTKDIGPLPTSTTATKGAAGTAAVPASATVKGSKTSNEADSLRIAGAAVGAILGALGIAVMML